MGETASERTLEFRVGLFVAAALFVLAAMIFQFGKFDSLWKRHDTYAVHFDRAPGIYAGSPVRMNGISIGRVRKLVLDERRGGVIVLIDVDPKFPIRRDSRPQLLRSLLGDAAIEFTPGSDAERVRPGTVLEGTRPAGLNEVVRNLNLKVAETLDAFARTSRSWQELAGNVNGLLTRHRGQFDRVLQETVAAVSEFHHTMQTANAALKQLDSVLADPEYRAALNRTMQQLPQITEQTRLTLTAAQRTIAAAERSLNNLGQATEPLAKNAAQIAERTRHMVGELDRLATQLNQFAAVVLKEDGTLQRFASDPRLYENLNRSAAGLSLLLENLRPVVADLQVFADKVARHPELIGVRGALRGSAGVK